MCGGELTFTEMISANGLVYENQKTLAMLLPVKEEYPIGVQIFGSDPEIMSEAAVICQEYGATIIDINMGCPQKKVVKTGAGAALMLTPRVASKIVEEIAKKVSIPVSCKIRLGWDTKDINGALFAKMLEQAGASMVTVHGRTRSQMFSGRANWPLIKTVKENLSIPVIANGDVKTLEDAIKCLEESNADGVMIGRAAIGSPWIIGQVADGLHKGIHKAPDMSLILDIIDFHLEMIEQYYTKDVAPKICRKHLAWYTKGMRNSASFRNHLFTAKTMEEIRSLAKDYFQMVIKQ